MKIKLTLQRAGGPSADIVVTTDASATVGDVASVIGMVDPLAPRAASTDVTLQLVDAAGNGQKVLEPQIPLGEAAIGSGATVAIVAAGSGPAPVARAEAAAVLVVVEGPDAGAEFPLPIGTRFLGRDASVSDVTLADPLVSKRHARLDVFSQSIRIVDLNSANGLEIDGGTVTRVDLENGDTVRIGDSLLRARIVAPVADATPVASGPIAFNRSPRVEVRFPGSEHTGPSMPSEKDNQPFPWLAAFLPLILGGVFIWTGRPIESLIFIAASPVLIVGTFLSARGTRKRKEKMEITKFNERAEYLEKTLDAEAVTEKEVRLREAPSTTEVYAAAMDLGPLLWTRRPEHWQFLNLNLGVGTMPSRNTITLTNEEAALPAYLERMHETRDKYRTVADVPVTENLYFAGALGIAGARPAAADMARGILIQAVGLHSPAEVVVAAIVSNAWTSEFEWLKWLPHTGSAHSPIEAAHLANSQATGDALLSALEALINTRNKAKIVVRGAVTSDKSALEAGASAGEGADVATAPPSATPAILLLISDDAPVDRARLVQMAERAADAGVYPVWVSQNVASLPAVTRTFVDVASDGATAKIGLVRLGSDIVDARTEPVSREQALAMAKRLAPVVDAGALLRDASDLPRTVSMLSLLGPDIAVTPSVAVDRWRQNDSIHDRSGGPLVKRRAGRLRALVGQSGVDAMHLDLRTQGPHALVGGTTGSGKSEFLQAWVLGMAAEYSPDRVTFLFVDYKGGSAFADCVNLPHCVGLVTDLSPHLVRRALTSLRAELHYREHLFNRKKAKDLIDLEKSGDPETPPALVLVIDEFAALAGDVPEFVDGVVDIAQRGRSLGIHLIMALSGRQVSSATICVPTPTCASRCAWPTNPTAWTSSATRSPERSTRLSLAAASRRPAPGASRASSRPTRVAGRATHRPRPPSTWPSCVSAPNRCGRHRAERSRSRAKASRVRPTRPASSRASSRPPRRSNCPRPGARGSTNWRPPSTSPSCASAPTPNCSSGSATCPRRSVKTRCISARTPTATSQSTAPADRGRPSRCAHWRRPPGSRPAAVPSTSTDSTSAPAGSACSRPCRTSARS